MVDRNALIINKMNFDYIRNRKIFNNKLSVVNREAAKSLKNYYNNLKISVLRNKHSDSEYVDLIGSLCTNTVPCNHTALYCDNEKKNIGYCIPKYTV